jgi:hypothetical protein
MDGWMDGWVADQDNAGAVDAEKRNENEHCAAGEVDTGTGGVADGWDGGGVDCGRLELVGLS